MRAIRKEVTRPDGVAVVVFELEEGDGRGGGEAEARASLDAPRSTADGAEDLAALARALGVTNAEAQRRAVKAALDLLDDRT